MIFLRVFKHLLPRGRAWRITVDKKLRQFFAGLSGVGESVKTFLDLVWLDIFPDTTREVPAWEQQFGLPNTGLSIQERRDRLAATWRALGGQSSEYIQSTLQANGFDVYVHEWWWPGSAPSVGVKECVTPRSPLMYLRREYTNIDVLVECGELLAACGESFAEAGNGPDPRGYPLVNKILRTLPDFTILCGEPLAACGELLAESGGYTEFKTDFVEYVVPLDPKYWPYFLYIGAEDFGNMAQVDPRRKDEFERLCLKICPAHQWLGMLVEYN